MLEGNRTKEEQIQYFMELRGLPRKEAELAYAIEAGDTARSGDVVIEEETD